MMNTTFMYPLVHFKVTALLVKLPINGGGRKVDVSLKLVKIRGTRVFQKI